MSNTSWPKTLVPNNLSAIKLYVKPQLFVLPYANSRCFKPFVDDVPVAKASIWGEYDEAMLYRENHQETNKNAGAQGETYTVVGLLCRIVQQSFYNGHGFNADGSFDC